MMLMRCFCVFFVFFFPDFLYKSICCIKFKWIPTTYAFIKKQSKSTLAVNLETMESLDCELIGELIGVCVVIRSHMIFQVEKINCLV